MKEYILGACVILFAHQLYAVSEKEALALALFKEARIESTLKQTAEQHFPGLSEDLQMVFGQDQEKFNAIFTKLRTTYIEKWILKVTETYKNLWVIAYTKNFSEEELAKMFEIYRSDLFKRFQQQFDLVDLAHLDKLTRESGDIMLAYNQLLKDALLEAEKQRLDKNIVSKKIEDIEFLQENIRTHSSNSLKINKDF